jgi:hypothetical protein
MLSLITPADAAPACAPSRTGTWFFRGAMAVPRDPADWLAVLGAPGCAQGSAMPFAQSQAREAIYQLGSGTQAAGQASLARQQRSSKVRNAHTTRIAARRMTKGGGHLGPQPPGDPV